MRYERGHAHLTVRGGTVSYSHNDIHPGDARVPHTTNPLLPPYTVLHFSTPPRTTIGPWAYGYCRVLGDCGFL